MVEMKLDRNVNRGGHGKYALVNMRKVVPMLDAAAPMNRDIEEYPPELKAFMLLVEKGIITLGNETPGDQFFVMKYKDKFTHDGLSAYAGAVMREGFRTRDASLHEYADQIMAEAAAAKELGNRIPD